MSKLANERTYKEPDFKTKKIDGVDFVYTVILLLIVAFTSGLFKYSLIAVGSDSMSPTFKKGDAVLIDQEVTKEDIKEQDVVLFDNNGKTIIHRIVKIEENNNKQEKKINHATERARKFREKNRKINKK